MADKRELSRRELRKKRRIRNQILAYSSFCVILVTLLVGIVLGGRTLYTYIEEKHQEKVLAEELAAMEESMSSAEAEEDETEAEEVVEEYTEDDLLKDMVDASIGEMSIEDRVAGLFLTTPETLTGVGKVTVAGDGMEKSLAEYAVGGLVFTEKSVSPLSLGQEKFGEIVSGTVARSKYPLFFILDNGEEVEDVSGYGINMEFEDKSGNESRSVFRTAMLPELMNETTSEEAAGGLTTALIVADSEEDIVAACLQAWENGADLLYVPEKFAEAYEGLLAEIQGNSDREGRLRDSMERIYRMKYANRANVEGE